MQLYEIGERSFYHLGERAIRIGEFRKPLKGEWYLSGGPPSAWLAPNDLGTEFHILRLVKVKRVSHLVIIGA